FPKPAYDPHRDFSKFDPPRSLALSLYGLVQFTALVAANSQFLALLSTQATYLSVAYFVFIVASLECLGGVLENRREFLVAETARLAAIGLGVPAVGSWFGGLKAPWFLASLVSFAGLSLVWLWMSTREMPQVDAARRAA